MNRKLQWMREKKFLEKKIIKHQLQYHMINMKKVIFFEKDKRQNILHEQKLVNHGLNIITARDVKRR